MFEYSFFRKKYRWRKLKTATKKWKRGKPEKNWKNERNRIKIKSMCGCVQGMDAKWYETESRKNGSFKLGGTQN